MRRGVLIFILLLSCLVLFLVHEVWTLLSLLVVSGVDDAITHSELPAPNSEREKKGPRMIPKIIHQTYKTKDIPPVWQEAQRSCKDLHREEDGWQYMLWTDDVMRDFIKKEYPWFLATYDGYPYPIQRADVIRYFILTHYGGIYIDLDDGCNRALEPLLAYPAWVRKTIPTGISNDVMGSVQGHPFFRRVVDELQNYNHSWILSYITVMASTGPLFLSIIWRHYSSEGLNVGDGKDGGRIRILFPEEYQNFPWSFFTHHLGNSWHAADVKLIFWLSRNWIFVTVLGFTLGGGFVFFLWWAYRKFILSRSPTDVPKWKTASIKSRFPFWRSTSVQKEYELVSRHEV